MNKTLVVALAIVGAAVLIVIVLAGGGDPQATGGDRGSDVTLGEGNNPPGEAAFADITEASVTKSDGDVVFEVRMARDLSAKAPKDVLSFRWDLTENGEDSWIVSAEIVRRPVASLQSLGTSFGASTIDGTLPGTISVTGDKVTVTIQAADVEGFPASFGWKLTTTLDGDRADPSSAVVTDTAPDNGPGKVE